RQNTGEQGIGSANKEWILVIREHSAVWREQAKRGIHSLRLHGDGNKLPGGTREGVRAERDAAESKAIEAVECRAQRRAGIDANRTRHWTFLNEQLVIHQISRIRRLQARVVGGDDGIGAGDRKRDRKLRVEYGARAVIVFRDELV